MNLFINEIDMQIFNRLNIVPLQKEMNMLAVLAPCGTIILYTGTTMIGKVHVGGVLTSFANLSTSFSSSFPRRSSLLPTIISEAMFDEELHTLSPVHPLQPQPTRFLKFSPKLV